MRRFIGAVIALGLLYPAANRAQSVAPPPAFEVASIRLSKDPAPGGDIKVTPGRFAGTDLALQWLILTAYRLRPFQLSGDLPGWTISERYTIDAKAENAASEDRVLEMIQTLVEDRFKLRFHRETKEGPVYVLTIAKGGLKMHPGTCVPSKGDLPNECGGYGRGEGATTTLNWRGVPISNPAGVAYRSLAWQLSLGLGRPVIDKTGLTGGYDVHLHWTADRDAGPNATGPSIFTAMEEQLGLKMEAARGPVEYFVVDHAERPSGN